MKSLYLLLLIFTSTYTLHAQSPWQLHPQAAYTLPAEGFRGDGLLSPEQGLRYGLHLDKMWRNFGLGLYAGFGLNDFRPRNRPPADLSGSLLNYQSLSNFDALRWKGYQGALGPVLQLGKKFNIQLFAKAGATIFDHRAYTYALDVREPVERTYTLLSANNVDEEKDYNLLLLTGLRVNIPLSGSIGLSLGADYTHIRDVVHGYTYLDAEFPPGAGEEEIIDILSTASTVTEVRQCHFNTIGLTVGLTFRFGKRMPRPPDIVDDEPDLPVLPEYPCEQLRYLAPGFNDVYTLQEKNQVEFQWADANVPGLRYELVLYARIGGAYTPIHTETTTQNRLTVDLNDIRGIANRELFWEINPLLGGNDACPYSTNKMRIHVFRDKKAAREELPNCKL